jgi:hypothetical protein
MTLFGIKTTDLTVTTLTTLFGIEMPDDGVHGV